MRVPKLFVRWIDDLLPLVRQVWGHKLPSARVVGGVACLSCLLEAGRTRNWGIRVS